MLIGHYPYVGCCVCSLLCLFQAFYIKRWSTNTFCFPLEESFFRGVSLKMVIWGWMAVFQVIGYGNFDIILDHLLQTFTSSIPPTYAV